jgi:uncharacterized paraquat-inducible protein A
MRRIAALAFVLTGLYAIAQAIALLESPVFLVMSSGGSPSAGLVALVLSFVPAVGSAALAAYLIISRESLAARFVAEEPVGVAVDAVSMLRVGLIIAGVLMTAQGVPSALRVLASPIVDSARMAALAGPLGQPVDFGQAYWGILPSLISPVVQLTLGVLLIARSSALATWFFSGPRTKPPSPESSRVCPRCGEPFDPEDYRQDAVDPRCTSCGAPLDLGRA